MAAERPHLPQRPYPLALHFSNRFGMPAIKFRTMFLFLCESGGENKLELF